MTIALNGFMGSGKSSVGKALSALLSCPLTDLDSYIENRECRKIPEIFSSDGEKAFRLIEYEALKEILSGGKVRNDCPDGKFVVLSLGGGTVMTPGCASLIKEKTLCIYLRAGIDTLVRNLENDHDGRPVLKTGEGTLRERIISLMSKRSSVYENTASLVIDIENYPADGKRGTGTDYEAIAREIAYSVTSF